MVEISKSSDGIDVVSVVVGDGEGWYDWFIKVYELFLFLCDVVYLLFVSFFILIF